MISTKITANIAIPTATKTMGRMIGSNKSVAITAGKPVNTISIMSLLLSSDEISIPPLTGFVNRLDSVFLKKMAFFEKKCRKNNENEYKSDGRRKKTVDSRAGQSAVARRGV